MSKTITMPLDQYNRIIENIQARVKELEREVHKRDSTIHNLQAAVKDKDGWIEFENRECQRLDDRVTELEGALETAVTYFDCEETCDTFGVVVMKQALTAQ